MNSKPFDYQGVSGQYKRGLNVQDVAGTNEFQDIQPDGDISLVINWQ